VSSTFWIETVKGTFPFPNFLQLQYTQLVLLNFNGLSWPHVTVATMRKAVPVTPPIWLIDPQIPKALLERAEAAAPRRPGDPVQTFAADPVQRIDAAPAPRTDLKSGAKENPAT
jgi:hypothetical protein